MTKTTKEERNEIRLLEARATMGPWLPSESTRVPKVLDRDGGLVCEFDTVNGTNDREAVAAMRNIFPDLLADLDAAEAERDELRQIAEGCCNATDGGCSPGVSIEFLRGVPKEVGRIRDQRDRAGAERDRAESELDAERRMRVEAEAASDRMVAERDALKARLAELLSHHQGQHAELQSILGSDDALAVLASRAVSDLAATKAKLAAVESAHSELFLSGQVAELRAKLAALVEAAEPFACDQGCDAVHHPVRDRHDQRDNCPVVARLRSAIAAARGGASC